MTLTDYMYQERREKEDASIEDSIYTSTEQLEDYIKKHKEGLITATRNNTATQRQQESKNGKKKTLWAF